MTAGMANLRRTSLTAPRQPRRRMALAALKQPRRRPGRPSFATDQTREALLDAAEALFAQFGVEGVSIRSINAAAGFSPAVVHSHFRTKDGLLTSVLLRRGQPTMARQRELIGILAAAGTPPTALDLVKAYAVPYRELIEQNPVGGLRWLQVLARLVLAQDALIVKLAKKLGMVENVAHLARLVFPDVPRRYRERNLSIAFGTLVQMMANKDIWKAYATRNGRRGNKLDLEMPARFVAAGLAEMMAVGAAPSSRGVSHRRTKGLAAKASRASSA